MRIKLTGLLIDKFLQENLNKQTGEQKKSYKAAIYQKDTHQLVNVIVSFETFNKLKEMEIITIECEVGTFVSNGRAIQYFREVA